MGFATVAASTQFLGKTAPFTAAPWSAGMWILPRNTTAQETLCINSSANTASYLVEGIKDTTWHFNCAEGSASDVTAGTVTAGAWHYVLWRGISATNRRISVLNANGSVSHAQNTTSLVPLNIDRMRIGEWAGSGTGAPLDGVMAEFWYATADIYPGGAAITDEELRRLAYRGPFSLPGNVVQYLREYLSLRTLPSRGPGSDWYIGAQQRMDLWTPNGSPVNGGPHPPLPSDYIRPGQTETIRVI